MLFTDLSLSEPILAALAAQEYTTPTPIQAEAIPPALEGRDVLGCAQTGTGKTAAFAIPVLEKLLKNPSPRGQKRRARALVLCPTRELASQIAQSFRDYGRGQSVRYTIICGGVSQRPQVDDLQRGVDIIVATPGRLKDLIDQRYVHLDAIDTFILDEADRMLDMGFIHDIRQIAALLPAERQTLFFSATMPPAIRKLAHALLRDPVTVEVAAQSTPADRIEESVYFVNKRDKHALLAHLLQTASMYRTIVFTRTKHGADHVVRKLHRSGLGAVAIHGNKSQPARQRALSDFAGNRVGVLVATDIASRGIDVEGVTHVVNFDVTHEPETYVHRIGRTARAGASGAAISLCDREERGNLRGIERLTGRSLKVVVNPLPPSEASEAFDEGYDTASGRPGGYSGGGSGGNSGGRGGQQRNKGAAGSGQSYDADRPRRAPAAPGRGSQGQFNRRRRRRSATGASPSNPTSGQGASQG